MLHHALAACAAIVLASPALAVDQELRQIPDEYETTSGHGIALNNGGYASNDAISAIRANPALMAQEKRYTMSGGYHWPVSGREYYQAAVVDSKTSPIAAGVSYTGYTDDYSYAREDEHASRFDSPIVRRGVVGFAQNVGAAALGIGATYVEGHELWSQRSPWDDDRRVKGVGLNAGISYPVSSVLSLGAAVENASNRKIKDYAPKTYKASAALGLQPGVVATLDYRQRDRVSEFEAGVVDPDAVDAAESLSAEQLGIAGISAQVQDFVKLIASYAQAFGDDRRSLAGGVALTSQHFSLSYTMARPYMTQSTSHQAVTLSLDVAM
jgi:hypothetical protein